MRNLALKDVENDYDHLKKQALNYFENGKIEEVFSIVSCAANIAYHFNFKYTDEQLEDLLKSVSVKIFQSSEFIPQKKKYVFYDCFGIDNRGLTQQYIRAFKDMEVELLYIKEEGTLGVESDIYLELKSNKLAKVYTVQEGLNRIERLQKVAKVIEEYMPDKAFLHLAPWSSSAVALWNNFDQVERYLIDLTDHAFWLGKSCSDFFIGFRDYGLSVSKKYRGISTDRLLKNLYYPIINEEEFEGFPFNTKNKVVIFSGGTFYKVYGEKDAYFRLLKRIVDENQNVVVVYAGNGDPSPFKKFINENKLVNRIYLLPERRDITQLFKKSHIYLNTFPIIGGLMSQYAIFNDIPLIGYTTKDVPCNFSESLCLRQDVQLSFTDSDSFHLEVNKLIASKAYRKEYVSRYKGLIPTPESFKDQLEDNIKLKNIEPYVDLFGSVEHERFKNIYFDMENNYLHRYDLIKFKWLGFRYFKIDFIRSMVSVLRLVANINLIVRPENIKRIRKKIRI